MQRAAWRKSNSKMRSIDTVGCGQASSTYRLESAFWVLRRQKEPRMPSVDRTRVVVVTLKLRGTKGREGFSLPRSLHVPSRRRTTRPRTRTDLLVELLLDKDDLARLDDEMAGVDVGDDELVLRGQQLVLP